MIYNVLEYLEENCRKTPDKIVVGDVRRQLCYRDFLGLSGAIGTRLAKDGYGKEPIAVLIDRDVYSVAAFMGIVYAGCFYVPIDKKLPAQRIETILSAAVPRARSCHGGEIRFFRSLPSHRDGGADLL